MRRHAVVRTLTLALAFIHTFPARKHLAAFAADPSWSEGWKGVGAVVAIALYLLPARLQSRGLVFLWRERRVLLRAFAAVLAVVHLVPAMDHVPALLREPTWGDAWRGIGSAVAVAWFLAPLAAQARLISWLGRIARLQLPRVPAAAPIANAVREP
jgi:hypothetical protein